MAQEYQSLSYYGILKIAPWATAQDIRRSYRELSKLYHPDTTTLPKALATAKFQQLNEAYSILSNPDRRSRYDLDHGYSRFSVMQPSQTLDQPDPSLFNWGKVRQSDRVPAKNLYLDPNDRPLSPGELFAVLLLGLTFVGCFALIIVVSLFRGDVVFPTDTLLN